MHEKIQDRREELWAPLHASAVFLLFLFFLFRHVNLYLWENLRSTYYYMAVPPLVAFCLYFRWGKNCVELRALIAFWLWYFVSRLLNGGQVLVDDFGGVLNFSLYFAFATVGFILKPEQRMRYLTWLGAVLAAWLSILGLISLYTALFRLTLINPITDGILCRMPASGFARLDLFDQYPNYTAMWFFVGMALTPFLFLRCKRKLWRVPVLLSALLCYLGLALTYSRNTRMAFAGCIAMLLVLLLINSRRKLKRWCLAAVCVLLVLVTIPAVYKSFDLATGLLGKISSAILAEETAEPAALSGHVLLSAEARSAEPAPAGLAASDAADFQDDRDLLEQAPTLAGRTYIFKSAFITMIREPSRLLRGCGSSDVMSVSDQVLPEKYPTMHNSWLEAMVLTGLPGLAITLLFSVLLIRRMFLVFFSGDPRLSLPVKCLTLPLAGMFSYSMLEPLLFFETEFCAQFFYLCAGMLLAWSYEAIPSKNG